MCEFEDYKVFVNRRLKHEEEPGARVLHCLMGLTTEVGELVDIFKKAKFYGKELPRSHVLEELGDILFYAFGAMAACDISPHEVVARNKAKLTKRYPEGFTEQAALARADKDPGEE
jgi:NTP pyrophosphatase (non-canonical NTP hydrolase)